MTNYRCNKCGKVVKRDSDKAWIRSWCESADAYSRLWRVKA